MYWNRVPLALESVTCFTSRKIKDPKTSKGCQGKRNKVMFTNLLDQNLKVARNFFFRFRYGCSAYAVATSKSCVDFMNQLCNDP